MPRRQHEFHFLYKTTNLVNGKYYVGMHSTSNLSDEYLGSGKRLWYSIRKHGRENHVREILEFFPDRKSLKEKEIEFVNAEMLSDPLCMNLCFGGERGFNPEAAAKGGRASIGKNGHLGSKEVHRRIREDEGFKQKWVEKINSTHLERTGSKNGWKGKTHREEVIEAMRNSRKEFQKGEKNSQFGKMWIYNIAEKRSIRVDKAEIDKYLSQNWKLGRKMKF
jgi:hypothetical protein